MGAAWGVCAVCGVCAGSQAAVAQPPVAAALAVAGVQVLVLVLVLLLVPRPEATLHASLLHTRHAAQRYGACLFMVARCVSSRHRAWDGRTYGLLPVGEHALPSRFQCRHL